MTKITSLMTFASAATIALTSMAFSADEYNTTNGLTLNGNLLGFHGSDTVALITDERLLAGNADHTVVHDGVEYYFATTETQEKFKANPNAYLPQFGGFCALGIAVKKKLDGSPRFADIRNGKLYVFVNQKIYNKYMEDPVGTIAKAEANWPAIKHTPISDL